MAPAVEHAGALRPGRVSVHDPRTRLHLEPRRRRRARRARGARAASSPRSSNPVRWDLCMETMGELGVTGVIEVPPAGTLTGPDQARAARRRDRRAQDPGRPRRRPRPGRAARQRRPAWTARRPGGWSSPRPRASSSIAELPAAAPRSTPGAAVGTLVTSRDEQPVVAPHGGTVVEWLVEDGDPVAPGQPIIRLHPRRSEPVH